MPCGGQPLVSSRGEWGPYDVVCTCGKWSDKGLTCSATALEKWGRHNQFPKPPTPEDAAEANEQRWRCGIIRRLTA